LSSPGTRALDVSDVFFFAGYLTVMVGLLRLSHEPLSRAERWNAVLDLAVLSLISGVAVWEVSLRDLVSTLRTTGNAESLVALLYALLNFALLLALYFQLVVNLGRGRMFVPHLLLVCAGLCLTVSDLASGVVAVATGASPVARRSISGGCCPLLLRASPASTCWTGAPRSIQSTHTCSGQPGPRC
ncbi:MAG: hypothetical protein NTW72_00910, partial [Gemmatimonadetes bacterium]|nr:hypothetical protein [Gemmatimonadota bacterium]